MDFNAFETRQDYIDIVDDTDENEFGTTFEPIYDIDTKEYVKDDSEDECEYVNFILLKIEIKTQTNKQRHIDYKFRANRFCCVSGCRKTASTRSKASLKLPTRFKQTDNDKICHSCYFSNLYQFKKI